MPRSRPTLDDYAKGVRSGDRTMLARAITLIESRHPDHKALAQELLVMLGAHGHPESQRVGITGVPGVGKSTFIDAFGTMLTAQGHKVAVLAVDPSSSRTGGSILGDKTRMARLAVDKNAFIRPSPASGTLGGVTRTTRETMLLCEAAGYDVILVETVGVGQSETVVADMVDVFLALMLPGAGDDLQGIKKGILEVADLIAVNKADGDNKRRAETAARDYRMALHIVTPASPTWSPVVLTCAGLAGAGLEDVWGQVQRHRDLMTASGERAQRRRDQQLRWMWSMLEERLISRFCADPAVQSKLADLEAAVLAGRVTPVQAVAALLGD